MKRRGFFDGRQDGITVGKGITALKNSRQGYNQLLAMFGGSRNIPSSVMIADRHKVTQENMEKDAHACERSYKASQWDVRNGITDIPDDLRKAFGASGRGCASGALSVFPRNVGRSVILMYSEPGQTIVDPFSGHNSRLELAVRAGRHYIGCDLSTEFMEFNRKRAAELKEEFPNIKIKLHHCDSRKMPVKSEIGDFSLTSPPYFDIEYYGDEPEQLGKSETYEDFLHGLSKVMKENYRTLKHNTYSVWFINDFRKDGKMHFYHMDVKTLGEQAGFVAHDIIIVDLGRGLRDCFPNQVIKSKIVPKRHEYGLVFYKP